MSDKEATARIKINKLLEAAGWRFFSDGTTPANIRLEPSIAIQSGIPAIKTYFKAYVTSNRVRDIIDSRQFTDLATNSMFSIRDFRAVPEKYRSLVPEYIKDYVSLNQFAAPEAT
jgi:hypothetical protein